MTNELVNLNEKNTSIVLAALRHFQNAIEAGEDLSYLGDIVDLNIESSEINLLCETVNAGTNTSDWSVSTVVDSDGHLNIYVSHVDGTEVMDVGEDISDDWGCRLTTQKIEDDYKATGVPAQINNRVVVD
jgi:hypothetical protein